MTNISDPLFHVEVRRGLYLISSQRTNPTSVEKSLAPGNPTGNSYLVIGEKQAVLFDLAVDEPGLLDYANKLAGKPVQLVLSHGHYDHAYRLNEFSDVWMHPADEYLIREGMLGLPPISPCPNIHSLTDGDTIDLGDRLLDVFNIPGHTMGSILLLDRQTRTLLSGDTCARRLLYGISGFVPLSDFCNSLRHLQTQEFDGIYSAHDRCALPKAHIETMLKLINQDLPHTKQEWDYPGLEKMMMLVHGDQFTLDYFDFSAPVGKLETPIENNP